MTIRQMLIVDLRTTSFLMLALAVLGLTACGGSSSGGTQPNDPDPRMKSSALIQVTSGDDFGQFLRQGILSSYSPSSQTLEALLSDNGADDWVAAPDSNAELDYSGTYVLEANVDEADIVKYNGDYLFIAEQNSPVCCTAFEDASLQDPDGVSPLIRVLTTAPDEPSATQINTLKPTLPAGSRISGFYQKDDILVSLSTSFSPGVYGDLWMMPRYWQQGTTNVSLFDIGDIESASESWVASIEGNLVSSRRIGNTLYLITRFTPDLHLEYSSEEGDEAEQENKDIVNATALTELLPHITRNSIRAELFAPTDCYMNSNADSNAYSIITTITAIPLDDPDQLQSRCYNGETQGIYVAEQALYITYFDWEEGTTQIHKFKLDSEDVEYRGSGEVAGSLSYRLESDFYLSEFNGDLRVISSEWEYSNIVFLSEPAVSDETSPVAPEVIDEVDHRLTILRESTTALELEVVSTLPNAEHPEEIGKPNEDLYGVRFFQDRAYIVTFERIDPLYIVDLSNPEDPFIAGELELPGFSEFLHPVSDNLLLGIGKDVGESGGFSLVDGLKIELFDISDPAAPYSLDAVSIGDRGTNSQIFSTRHAFTYLKMNDSTHRFTLPVDRYLIQEQPPGDGSWGVWENTGLHLFTIDSIESPSMATLTASGTMIVETKVDGERYYPSQLENRAVIHDDSVFYMYGDRIWSAFWGDSSTVAGPF